MHNSKKINLIFLFYILLFSSLVIAQRVECDPTDRPISADCITQPREATCAYYNTNCPRAICGRPAINPCDACRYADVISYERKACDPEVVVGTCSDSTCDQTLPSWNITGFVPVCSLDDDTDRDDSDRETFENACALCRDDDYQFYQIGPCQKDRIYCGDTDASDNTDVSDLTDDSSDTDTDDDINCAYFTTPDVGSVFANVSSGPVACTDEAVEYWTIRACGPLFGNLTYCLPNNRPEECTAEDNPVCGFYKGENGRIAHKVFGNGCSACLDATVLYHVPGSCELTCAIPLNLGNCEGWISPVCGTYEENGEQINVSLRNACIGCSLSDKKILNFTDGLCPGDRGIRCENDAVTNIQSSSEAVCGYTTENCNSAACRQTYAGPNAACNAAAVIWYSPGACPVL